MRANRSTLVKLCLLTALAVPVQRAASAAIQASELGRSQGGTSLLLAQNRLAQAPEFDAPASLEGSETLLIDGSSSMRSMNEALSEQFQARYASAEVQSEANGTDVALDRLQDGDIDLAAIGRPLTEEEVAAGLVAVPIAREKIAIFVSPENSFAGDITFEEFGSIFRGEITEWEAVDDGSGSGPLRFVDRPATSDTRLAFRPYPVFQTAPFETGATADPVAVDETEAVIEALGEDGIGYAIANQVMGNPNVKIVPMHQTLPDDPAYPFSQPRNYVYLIEPSPAVAGFLAVATSPEGEAVIDEVRETEGAAAAQLESPAESVTSADGSLTARTDENNVAVIESADGTLVAGPLAGAGGAVTALAFSPDGETLATGTNTGKVRYWGVDGEPKGEPFEAVIGDDNAVTGLEFQENDALLVSGSNGRVGLWGLNGLPLGETATAPSGDIGGAVAAGDRDGAFPLWLLLIPLLGLLGGLGLWLLGRSRRESAVEPIRQTAPTATVPPPVTDPDSDREVSNRAQTVISTDRVVDESRAVGAAGAVAADTALGDLSSPDIEGTPRIGAEDISTAGLNLEESTDLESPDLEGTNLDLSTPDLTLGGAALGGAAIGGAVLGGAGLAAGLDAGVESDDDEDEWDDNLDLTLDDAPDVAAPEATDDINLETAIATPAMPSVDVDTFDVDTTVSSAADSLETDRLLEADSLEADSLEADSSAADNLELDRLEADSLEADSLEADSLEPDSLEIDASPAPAEDVAAVEMPTVDEPAFADMSASDGDEDFWSTTPAGAAVGLGAVGIAAAAMGSAGDSAEESSDLFGDLSTDAESAASESASESAASESAPSADVSFAEALGIDSPEDLTSSVSDSDELASTELASTELHSDEPAFDELASDEPASTELAFDELTSDEFASTELNSTEFTLGELATDELASKELASKEPSLENIEPTRETVIAEMSVVPDMEPDENTIIGDNAVIFGGAAASGAGAAAASSGDEETVVLGSAATAGSDDFASSGIAQSASMAVGIAGGAATAVVLSGDGGDTPSSPATGGGRSRSPEELADVDDGLYDLPDGYGESRIVLLPRDPKWAYTYWDVSNEHKQMLRDQGGQRLMLRLYDVTDIDQDTQAAHGMQQFACDEMVRSWYLEIPVSDRDYTAEIGYLTGDERWLVLARSAPMRVPPIYPSDWVKDQFVTIDFDESLMGKTFGALGRPDDKLAAGDTPVKDLPPIYSELFAMTQGQNALWVAGSLFGSMHQVPPGALTQSGMVTGVGAALNMSGLNVSGLNMSGLTMSGVGLGDRKRNFWLVADAELIVYGATEPNATLTIGDQVVPLSPDGTFRFHVAFPDGKIDYPIKAVAADGEQSRSITMNFERETPERNTNTKAEAQDEWF